MNTQLNQYWTYELLLKTRQHKLVVRIMDYIITVSGSIPDGVMGGFALSRQLSKNHIMFLARTSYDSLKESSA